MRADDIETITLKRGPCFGTCPVYSVTLCRDGTAFWSGEMFTAPLGNAIAQIDGATFYQLCEFVERCGFFEWATHYASDVTCTATYTLEVVANGEATSVRQMGTNDPPNFWTLARLIDASARDVGWGAPVEDTVG